MAAVSRKPAEDLAYPARVGRRTLHGVQGGGKGVSHAIITRLVGRRFMPIEEVDGPVVRAGYEVVGHAAGGVFFHHPG